MMTAALLIVALIALQSISVTAFPSSPYIMNQSPNSVAAIGKSLPLINAKVPMSDNENLCETNGGMSGIAHIRSQILQLGALVGQLSSYVLTKVPLDAPIQDQALTNQEYAILRPSPIEDKDVSRSMAQVLLMLLQICHSLSLKLEIVIDKKMKLNAKKYPADLCRGRAGKYTVYSRHTGIGKDNQSTTHLEDIHDDPETVSSFLEKVHLLKETIGDFATERLWAKYHKPRSLVLALLGEFGELCELFQWRGDHAGIESINTEDMDKIGQELADVSIYLLRLADVSNVDLKLAAESLLNQK